LSVRVIVSEINSEWEQARNCGRKKKKVGGEEEECSLACPTYHSAWLLAQ
jgi:hypothetical protein